MPKYVTFFSYTPETWAKLIAKPEDRSQAVRAAAEAGGSRMEAMYFMFGAHDGLVIFDSPDAETVAATAIAVASSGALKAVETHQLIETSDLVGILQRSGQTTGAYRAPGG